MAYICGMMNRIEYHKHTMPVNIGRWALAEGRHRELLVYLYARAIASVNAGYIQDDKLILIQSALGWTKKRFARWFDRTVECGLIERHGAKWHVVAAQVFHGRLLTDYFKDKRYAKMKVNVNPEWYKDLSVTQFKGLLYGWLKSADAKQKYHLEKFRNPDAYKRAQSVKEYAEDGLLAVAKDRGNASYRYFADAHMNIGLPLSTQSRLMKVCVSKGWLWRSLECDPECDAKKITTYDEMSEFLISKRRLGHLEGYESSRVFRMNTGPYAGQLRILRRVYSRAKTKEVTVFSSKVGIPKGLSYDEPKKVIAPIFEAIRTVGGFGEFKSSGDLFSFLDELVEVKQSNKCSSNSSPSTSNNYYSNIV
jgi:hypothetical protein